jgi:glutathione synthase/RimK-type ligase-like ATP-grasp enzyme
VHSADVLIACCRNEADSAPDDLYPDPDSEQLRSELARRGVRAALVSWDDPTVEWDAARLVLIRSTWDSVDRPDEYLAWARAVDAVTDLANPAPVVEWNLDKTYLRDLADDGVPVVPTTWASPGRQWDLPQGDMVVKPAISAGGRETAWHGADQADAARAHVERLVGEGRTVMIQPHLPSVADPGELSMIFLDGRLSHATRKGALLVRGEGVQERMWERMTYLRTDVPDERQVAVAGAALRAIDDRFGGPLVYSRVDVLDGLDGRPVVIEVELIDPYLSLGLRPGAVEALAAAVATRVS